MLRACRASPRADCRRAVARPEHERHDAQVLEEQDGDDDASVRRVELPAVVVDLENDRRRREREQRAEEDRQPRLVPTGEPATQRDGGDGRDHLQPAAADDPFGRCDDARERELEADREEQQDDADLGQRADGVGLTDEPQPVGPDGDAGEQKADDGRNAQALRE